MSFSIIIPVYNVEMYLRDCLNSVLKQTYSDWEAICVDDGSTDGSVDILKEYAAGDPRIKVFSQLNAGTATARNTGLKEANGDYIFFLDSDDWLEADTLRILSDRLNGEDILCFSGKRYFESTGCFNQADTLPEKEYTSGMDYYNENALLSRDFAFVCVVLRVYNREFILRNKLCFDNDVSYEDNLWVPIVLFHAQSVKVIPDVLYIYRIREGSKMQEFSLARRLDMLNVANRLALFFVPKLGFNKAVVYRAITHHYQSAFTNSSATEKKELHNLCDWRMYHNVCRTKLRHIMNYWKNRFCI